MDIWWLDTLVILVGFAASAGLPLGKLWIDPGLVVCLGKLDTLDRLIADSFSFLEGLVGATR